MKKTTAPSTAKKSIPETKPISVQLEEAVRKADMAKTKAGIAKAALKKARKAFKLARKAARAARKGAKALEKELQKAISKANGKSAAAAGKTSSDLRKVMEVSAHDPANQKPGPPVKRKRIRKKPSPVAVAQPVADVPPAEAESNQPLVLDDPTSAAPSLAGGEAAGPLT